MPDFNKYSLYESRALLTELELKAGEIKAIGAILTDRAGIQMNLLKQLALVANNQALNIFCFSKPEEYPVQETHYVMDLNPP